MNFRVCVGNLGKYNEGELVCEWIDLPATEDEIEELYVKIGVAHYEDGEFVYGLEVDGVAYEETAIFDSDVDIDGLEVGENWSLEDLNKLAEELDELSEHDIKKLQAMLELFNSDVREQLEHLDDYELLEHIEDHEDIGWCFVEEIGGYDLSSIGNLANYIDYEAFGRDIALETDGGLSSYGFLMGG